MVAVGGWEAETCGVSGDIVSVALSTEDRWTCREAVTQCYNGVALREEEIQRSSQRSRPVVSCCDQMMSKRGRW